MPSPFPGMDPWLEDTVFADLHDSLVIYIREALNAVLPDEYVANISQLVWVDDALRREPDVSAFGPSEPPAAGGDVAGALAAAGMLAVAAAPLPEPWTEPYLEIVSGEGERLVTAVEILSPSNKAAGEKGRAAYQQKQGELRLGNVNLVELDLLRGGTHTTAIPLRQLQRVAGRFDYHIVMTVPGEPERHFVRPIRLDERLPAIRIPLDPGVTPPELDLQPLLDRAYDSGRYAKRARYARDPVPPLAPEHKAWADAVLREKGLLPGGPT